MLVLFHRDILSRDIPNAVGLGYVLFRACFHSIRFNLKYITAFGVQYQIYGSLFEIFIKKESFKIPHSVLFGFYVNVSQMGT